MTTLPFRSRWAHIGALSASLASLPVACGGGMEQRAAAATSVTPTPAPTPAAVPAPAPAHTVQLPAAVPPPTVGRALPSPVIGVTLDDISGLSDIVESLRRLSKTPTVRIVFDENVPATRYRAAAEAIHPVGYVMGELLDSQYVDTIDVPQYLDRTTQYLAVLGDVVDLWEIGNEINGEWLGAQAEVVAKMSGAYDLVKAQHRRAALTLYYNAGCWSRAANEMFTWAERNVPARMKQGLDYVWLSYYEDDCNGLQPDWPDVFARVAAMFPNAKIGFGEVGTAIASRKSAYVQRYYATKLNEPRYVGGYFWWYYRQDMVPSSKALWNTLNATISAP